MSPINFLFFVSVKEKWHKVSHRYGKQWEETLFIAENNRKHKSKLSSSFTKSKQMSFRKGRSKLWLKISNQDKLKHPTSFFLRGHPEASTPPCHLRAAALQGGGSNSPAPHGRGWKCARCLLSPLPSSRRAVILPSLRTTRAAKANTDCWRRLSGEQLRGAGSPPPRGPPRCRHPLLATRA